MEKLETLQKDPLERINWLQSSPFILFHLVPFFAIWTGVTWQNIALCFFLYFLRMFFITGGYHRYFAHRGYKANRFMQFILAFGGGMSMQKGPLWWAGHHRHHHKYSDQPEDSHSPIKGFWWSHVGWFLSRKYEETPYEYIKDFVKYPEIRWINKYHLVPPFVLAGICYLIGGWGGLVVGFGWSTVMLYHGTFVINSLCHLFGRRRFKTTDTSRNSLILALVTMGEGWHNNHHHYQSTANQGFYWWEIDVTYYILKMMGWLGLIYDLRTPPKYVLENDLLKQGEADLGLQAAAELAEAMRSAVKVPLN